MCRTLRMGRQHVCDLIPEDISLLPRLRSLYMSMVCKVSHVILSKFLYHLDLLITRKFKSYVGLSSAFDKLERMIDDFEFDDIQTAVEKVNWEQAKKIRI